MSSAGHNGTDGENETDIKDPVPARGISRASKIINEYKMFLRENINNPFQKCALRKFLDLLDKNNDVRRLYDIHGLSGEFLDLEEQFLKLKKEMDVFPFYSSLLERIDVFAKDQKDILNSDENKKVLNYLYTALLGKIIGMKEKSEQNLIIDMRLYLSMVEDNIKTLKDLRNINKKVDIINKYKDIYKTSFKEKIAEAKHLIETQINPEINNISSKIDDQVKALIKETIDEQNKAEKDWEKLVEKKKALQSAMALKGLFNIFKIIGGAVSFLGPVGRIAGTVITGATTLIEPIALSDKEKILSLPDPVAKDLKTFKDQIEALRKQKLDHLNKLVKNISTEIDKNPETLGDMKDKVANIKEKLEKVSKKELKFKVAVKLQSELEKDIKKKGFDLRKDPNNKKKLDAAKALDKAAKVAQFSSLFTKMQGEVEKDNAKMDTITASMSEMEERMRLLREYEINIYENIAPMLQGMEKSMENISAKLGTASQVSLDVTKWKVQSTLKDIRKKMVEITKSYEGIKDEIRYSIENLEEVMTTMINVYDRIQTYQDQQNLANYIGDISSASASSINIEDQELVNVVNRLEFVIRANMVLEQYKKAIDGLKQWVFPFSDHYIEESMLPYHLQLEKNIDNLVQAAMKQIEEIVNKLNDYDASIVNGDRSLACEEFSSRYVTTRPFFVFENERYRSSISRLLSGKEVFLKAEVEESAPNKDAIKFSAIEFDLKVKNETSQSKLNKILKGFDIRASHLGNSYYRYDNSISLIISNNLTMKFSYERLPNGRPVRENQAYRRLRGGDLLLSPYTLWKLKLINQTNEYSFENLTVFENETNLELSGLGSYVDMSEQRLARNDIERFKRYESSGNGLKGCQMSVHRRSTRSVKGIEVDTNFATNDASKVMSSPINLICNFLKTYFVSNLVRLFFPIFYGEHAFIRIDNSDNSDFIKERIGKISNSFNADFKGNNRYINHFLLSNKEDRSSYHFNQFSDLNCSLLLADLVTRNITGNKYKSLVGEYLLSPREIMVGKICGGAIRNESDIKQMLQRHLSEKEVETSSSWFSKLKTCTKSMFRVFGFKGNTDTEEYIDDIRHLLA